MAIRFDQELDDTDSSLMAQWTGTSIRLTLPAHHSLTVEEAHHLMGQLGDAIAQAGSPGPCEIDAPSAVQ